MTAVSYYTPEGLKKLRDELNQLKDVERPKASQAIAEARDKGDLSENAEYDAKETSLLMKEKLMKRDNMSKQIAFFVPTMHAQLSFNTLAWTNHMFW